MSSWLQRPAAAGRASRFAPAAVRPALAELRSVVRSYGSGDSRVLALANADLRVEEGEFLAIMGASGSGKSTCLNILGCLDTPSSGQQLFRGSDVGALSADQRARLRRQYLGYVFQGFNLLARTSALENVELPLIYRRVARAERRRVAVQALRDVGLEHRLDHTPAELSGGQQQRVAIARALVTAPQLILADEPTGNLDSTRKVEIMSLFRDLNQRRGIAIVMVTHEPEMAAYAHRTVYFQDGRVRSERRRVQWAG
jgi:putative ABC transport system ATP-binding protein